MPYKPTGKPPGRPRKLESTAEPSAITESSAAPEPAVDPESPAVPVRLTRARAAYRRAFPNPAEDLHTPPRYGARRRHVGKRPILHPNVIAGGAE